MLYSNMDWIVLYLALSLLLLACNTTNKQYQPCWQIYMKKHLFCKMYMDKLSSNITVLMIKHLPL